MISFLIYKIKITFARKGTNNRLASFLAIDEFEIYTSEDVTKIEFTTNGVETTNTELMANTTENVQLSTT